MQHLKTKWLGAKINNFTGLFIAQSVSFYKSLRRLSAIDRLHSSPSFTNKTKIWVWLKAIVVFILLGEAFTVWFADQPTDEFSFFFIYNSLSRFSGLSSSPSVVCTREISRRRQTHAYHSSLSSSTMLWFQLVQTDRSRRLGEGNVNMKKIVSVG